MDNARETYLCVYLIYKLAYRAEWARAPIQVGMGSSLLPYDSFQRVKIRKLYEKSPKVHFIYPDEIQNGIEPTKRRFLL